MRFRGKALAALALGSLALIVGSTGPAFAQDGNGSDNSAAAFSRIGVGARALGMGGAYTAVADDATASMWNPAGIARVDNLNFTFMYTGSYDYDRSHNFFGYAQSFSMASIGIGWTNAGWDDFDRYGSDNTFGGNFDLTDNLIHLVVARQYGPFGFGVAGKIFDQEIDDESQSGGGVDVGSFFEPNSFVTFGLAIQDLWSEIDEEEVPFNIRSGVALHPIGDLTIAADIEHGEDSETVFHLGVESWFEYHPGYMMALRAGVSDLGRDHQDEGYSLGIGLKVPKMWGIGIDYAFVNEMEEFLGENHRISLNLGFGERERDRDGDGIPDYDDGCPNSAEDFDGFEDEDGCPDLDNDGDGIIDELDSCPDEAEDFDGVDDADGCPEMDDQDGDGILDVDDQCIHEPEDFDGFEDADGCPDLDNDEDGIPDTKDRCMNNAETYNGYMDDDGCPDIAPRENLNGVHFEFNSAKLKLGSQQILDELVRALAANPDVKIEIQGHTDAVGDAAYNKQLSQARATTVMNYIVNHDINASRLSSVGYGEEKPIASNDTAEGRLENRRVEVIRIN